MAAFPGRIPSRELTLQEVGVLRGEQRVIEHLQKLYREQQKLDNLNEFT